MSRYDAAPVLAQLKDFQRATVDTVVERFYPTDRSPPVHRFLVADEVGLGKTLVARGVIARTIEHLQDRVDRIDVVYVCSNAHIARQNVRRLRTQTEGNLEVADRLTMLPVTAKNLAANRVNVVSFTPGTSFDLKGGGGQVRERAVLRLMLEQVWGPHLFRSQGSFRIFQGGVRTLDRFKQQYRWVRDGNRRTLDRTMVDNFAKVIEERDGGRPDGSPSLRERFDELVELYGWARPQSGWHWKEARKRNEFMGDLRDLLARACLNSLEPDLIILDEFQRFKHLLASPDDEERSPAAELAHELFSYVDAEAGSRARVMLLSATPYKMLTSSGDAEDNHYEDLIDTAEFLLEHDAGAVATLQDGLRDLRQGLLQAGRDGGRAARSAKGRVEPVLRRVMVRTERLGATRDRSGMLTERPCEGLDLRPQDVGRYVAGARLARALDVYDPLEYWLSAPNLVNFMDGYKLNKAFDDRTSAPDAEVTDLATRAGLLDFDRVRGYDKIDLDNGRMRWLVGDVVGRGAWKLLWVPPALPYLQPGGPYAEPALQDFTKRLIFSSWTLAPRAISTLVSYEMERRRVAASGPPAFDNTPAGRQGRALPLTFSMDGERPRAMPVFALLYPSAVLAEVGDPLTLPHSDADGPIPADDAVEQVAARIEQKLSEMRTALADSSGGPDPSVGPGRVDERWYWVAPLWLDWLSDQEATDDLFWAESRLVSAFAGGAPHTVGERFADHVRRAGEALSWEYGELGTMPDDLGDVLARIALAGPGVCALRALTRITDRSPPDYDLRLASCRIAWGLRGLFNGPEVIELVRGLFPGEPYWQRVLDYCLAGNLQAMLDEYVHVLCESRGHLDPSTDEAVNDVAGAVFTASELRTVSYGVRRVTCEGSTVTSESDRMRANTALRLTDEKAEDGTQTRTSDVRDAFNSPFQPFVLATTSAGQEGLDFHLFCHAVVHWNLPGNPVDLEQREGRVHRYKGHAVRRNLADRYGRTGRAASGDPWAAMFAAACADRPPDQNEIWPYWVFAPEAAKGTPTAQIERYVPALALSRDRAWADELQRSVALYRLAFGQPRQDDLLAYLSGQIDPTDFERLVDDLRIDLGPKS